MTEDWKRELVELWMTTGRDVAMFIASSLDVVDRREHERDLVELHLESLERDASRLRPSRAHGWGTGGTCCMGSGRGC